MNDELARIPVLTDATYAYAKARSLMWVGDGLSLPQTFQAGAGKLLRALIEKYSCDKILVLDCEGVYGFGNHPITGLQPVVDQNEACVILIHAEHCCSAFENHIKEEMPSVNIQIIKHLIPGDCMIFGRRMDNINFNSLISSFESLTRKKNQDIIRRCYRKFSDYLPDRELSATKEKRLQSTPLLAKGVFSARTIISNPSDFIHVTLELASKISRLVEDSKVARTYRVLSVSLRASPFAAAAATILGVPCEIVDHMGPRMKILEEYTFDLSPSESRYIYVGDFCIGGSEVKIADTYATIKGTKLEYAIVIGAVLSVQDMGGEVPIHSLELLGDIHSDIEYRLNA